MTLDKMDREILRALQENAWLSNEEIGQKVHLSHSNVSRRRLSLEERGILKGAKAIVDAGSVGLGCTVYILVRVREHTKKELQNFTDNLSRWDNVVEWASIIGSWDYMVKVMVHDLKDYAVFYQKLQAVEQVVQLRGLPAFDDPVHSPIPLSERRIPVETWPVKSRKSKLIEGPENG